MEKRKQGARKEFSTSLTLQHNARVHARPAPHGQEINAAQGQPPPRFSTRGRDSLFRALRTDHNQTGGI